MGVVADPKTNVGRHREMNPRAQRDWALYLCKEIYMHRMSEESYRELRALFDHLVDAVDTARSQFRKSDPRLQELDAVLYQAHAYQHTSCERCGAQFESSSLHAESYATAGYRHVCPRCNRELGGTP
jgi:hypothetical protein